MSSYTAGTSSRIPGLVFRPVAMGSGRGSSSHGAPLALPPGEEACSSSQGDAGGGHAGMAFQRPCCGFGLRDGSRFHL